MTGCLLSTREEIYSATLVLIATTLAQERERENHDNNIIRHYIVIRYYLLCTVENVGNQENNMIPSRRDEYIVIVRYCYCTTFEWKMTYKTRRVQQYLMNTYSDAQRNRCFLIREYVDIPSMCRNDYRRRGSQYRILSIHFEVESKYVF